MADFYRTTDGISALNADTGSRRTPQDHIMTHAAARPTRSMWSEIGPVVRVLALIVTLVTVAFITGYNP